MSARDIASAAFSDALRSGLDVTEAEQVARMAYEYATTRNARKFSPPTRRTDRRTR